AAAQLDAPRPAAGVGREGHRDRAGAGARGHQDPGEDVYGIHAAGAEALAQVLRQTRCQVRLDGPRAAVQRVDAADAGAVEPNLAPGLTEYLGERLGTGGVDPVDVLAWILVAARPGPGSVAVPLPADPGRWSRGVELGRRVLWLMRRDGERPKLPGGRRPYVRAPLPSRPVEFRYDRDEESLVVDEGRISPVPSEAWDFHVGGVRVLEEWFTRRTEPAQPGTLEAIRPATWPQSWTSELLELITVLALLAELRPSQEELTVGDPITTTDLRRAGVLPVPDSSRRPASVLDHREEGPEGQFTLL
uniref:type ISP restriction/modification enzyme n=2 Tax=Streptomyces caniscabiei TaxID=2746961 RepID=UPI0030B96533